MTANRAAAVTELRFWLGPLREQAAVSLQPLHPARVKLLSCNCKRCFVPNLRCLAEWFSAVLLMLCMAVAASAQSKDIDRALLARAKAGDVESQSRVGLAYEDRQEYALAASWLRKAAEK